MCAEPGVMRCRTEWKTSFISVQLEFLKLSNLNLSYQSHAGLKINMVVFVLEVRKRTEYLQHREGCLGQIHGSDYWLGPSLGNQTKVEPSGDVSYGSNETTLAFVTVASQGYQAVAEQIRQLIFSRANGVLWIMSWASRVSSSLHFVEWVWFVYHKCLWSDHWVHFIF